MQAQAQGVLMGKVTSADGTEIAYDKIGEGPPLILVGGAFNTRTFGPSTDLPGLLADRFTVYHYDRRGRGESGDTRPYSVEREVEDIAALITEAGGSAHLYGISSGGVLAMEAAARGLAVNKLAVFEPLFVVDDSRPPVPDYAGEINKLLADGRPGKAVKLFLREGAMVPGFFVAIMPLMPGWKQLKVGASSLPYDVEIVEDMGKGTPVDKDRWAALTMPTLVMVGGKSPTWAKNGMDALAKALPNARHHLLPGQMHVVSAKAMAPVLAEFFGS